MGLLYACARFGETKGIRFSTYAWKYIRGFILRGRNDWFRSDIADVYLGMRSAHIPAPPASNGLAYCTKRAKENQ
jgi:hypothetical protein